MWPKDAYQEQMLGYLSEMETEIGQLAHSRLRQHELDELYTDLEITVEELWRLIGASDLDWEKFRSPLEISCDVLLRAFYHMQLTGTFMLSADTATYALHANLTRAVEIRTNADDTHDNNRYAESSVLNDFARTLVRKELA